jgi:hypothetical protein
VQAALCSRRAGLTTEKLLNKNTFTRELIMPLIYTVTLVGTNYKLKIVQAQKQK